MYTTPPFLPALTLCILALFRYKVPLFKETRPPSNLDLMFSKMVDIERLADCYIVISILYNSTLDGRGNAEGTPEPSP